MTKRKVYDVIIIGGSYSGLSAAMALGRALLNVLVIDSGMPCNRQTPHSHNFLTRDGSTPADISKIGREQVGQYKTVEFMNAKATGAEKSIHGFEVAIESGDKILSSKLIFATGIKDIMPEIEGFVQCWGISVLHCPYCHGYEIKGKNTGILANGNEAFELAWLISNWTDQLTIFTNGVSTIVPELRQQLLDKNIQVIEDTVLKFNHRDGYLKSIEFTNRRKMPIDAIYSKLPFVQHCRIPSNLGCETNEEGYLKIDGFHETTVQGIYACGDNVTRMRTVSNAVAMGTATGISVSKKIINERFQIK